MISGFEIMHLSLCLLFTSMSVCSFSDIGVRTDGPLLLSGICCSDFLLCLSCRSCVEVLYFAKLLPVVLSIVEKRFFLKSSASYTNF